MKCEYDDGQDDRDLQQREDELKIARLSDSDVIQSGNEDGGGDRDQGAVSDGEGGGDQGAREKRKNGEGAENAHQAGGHGRDGGGFGDDEPGPGVKKPGEGAVAVAHVNIFATGLGFHSTEFGIGERAEKRQQAAHDPGEVNEASGTDSLHHLGGNEKDSAADDGADHDGSSVADAQVAREFEGRGARCVFSREFRHHISFSVSANIMLARYPVANVTVVPMVTYQVQGMLLTHIQIETSVANPSNMPTMAPDWLARRVSKPSRKTPSKAPYATE